MFTKIGLLVLGPLVTFGLIVGFIVGFTGVGELLILIVGLGIGGVFVGVVLASGEALESSDSVIELLSSVATVILSAGALSVFIIKLFVGTWLAGLIRPLTKTTSRKIITKAPTKSKISLGLNFALLVSSEPILVSLVQPLPSQNLSASE